MKYINLEIPEHSYFFGFVQTDGNLNKPFEEKNKGRLAIELGERDKNLLKSFKELFPLVYSGIRVRNRDTNFRKNYRSYALTICNMDFRSEINRLGIPYGKKSLIISPPEGNFSEKDYIRGLIDGDGSVGITAKGIPFISLTIKSEELKDYFLSVIERITGERKRLNRNKRDNIYNIMINREKAQEFIKYLYYSNCLTLKRKFRSAKTALRWKRPKGMRRVFQQKRWEKWEDKYILSHTIKENCSYLDRTKNSIGMRLWRLKNNKIRI